MYLGYISYKRIDDILLYEGTQNPAVEDVDQIVSSHDIDTLFNASKDLIEYEANKVRKLYDNIEVVHYQNEEFLEILDESQFKSEYNTFDWRKEFDKYQVSSFEIIHDEQTLFSIGIFENATKIELDIN